jgi:tyrosinase
MAGSMVYRLPVADATASHMITFRRAMGEMQGIWDNRGYNYIAGFHGLPNWYCWHTQANRRTPLQARLFLPWHRAYLLRFERMLQDRVPGVSVPYWNWVRVRDIPSAYAARRIDNQANPLYSARVWVPTARPRIDKRTRRSPGSDPRVRLPDQRAVDWVLNESDWATAADLLENVHNTVHNWVRGDMLNQETAAWEPLFWVHHSMVDRIWSIWQVRYGNGGIPRDLLDLELIPFGQRTRDVLDVQRLGYEYAASATEIPIGGGGNA